jgi:hypothetical protein
VSSAAHARSVLSRVRISTRVISRCSMRVRTSLNGTLRGRWSSEGISARSSAKTVRGSNHAYLLDVLRRSFMPHARIR